MYGTKSFFPVCYVSHILLVPLLYLYDKGQVLQQQREENVFPVEGSLSLEDLLRPFVILLFTFLVQYIFHFLIYFPLYSLIAFSFQLLSAEVPVVFIRFIFA